VIGTCASAALPTTFFFLKCSSEMLSLPPDVLERELLTVIQFQRTDLKILFLIVAFSSKDGSNLLRFIRMLIFFLVALFILQQAKEFIGKKFLDADIVVGPPASFTIF